MAMPCAEQTGMTKRWHACVVHAKHTCASVPHPAAPEGLPAQLGRGSTLQAGLDCLYRALLGRPGACLRPGWQLDL